MKPLYYLQDSITKTTCQLLYLINNNAQIPRRFNQDLQTEFKNLNTTQHFEPFNCNTPFRPIPRDAPKVGGWAVGLRGFIVTDGRRGQKWVDDRRDPGTYCNRDIGPGRPFVPFKSAVGTEGTVDVLLLCVRRKHALMTGHLAAEESAPAFRGIKFNIVLFNATLLISLMLWTLMSVIRLRLCDIFCSDMENFG